MVQPYPHLYRFELPMVFDILSIIDVPEDYQYDPDVDHMTDTSWRLRTMTERAHKVLATRLADHKYLEGVDCTSDLDFKDRVEGGVFGVWIIRLRKGPALPLAAIAATFPCLRDAPTVLGPGGSPGKFERNAFWAWAERRIEDGVMPPATRHAVLFILHLHDPCVASYSGIGSFNLPDALASWDRKHLDAFLTWADAFRAKVPSGVDYMEALAHLAKYPKGDKRFIEALQMANLARCEQAEGKHVSWGYAMCEIAEEMTMARGLTSWEADRFRCTNGRSIT